MLAQIAPLPARQLPERDLPDVTTRLLVRVAGWAVLAIGGVIALLLALDPVGQSTSRILFNLGAGLVAVSHIAPHVPEAVYAMFQLCFAVITAALVVGAFVERMRFSAMLVFISLWTLCIYAPVALSGSGTVKIYAASKPAAAITLQSILCIKAV